MNVAQVERNDYVFDCGFEDVLINKGWVRNDRIPGSLLRRAVDPDGGREYEEVVMPPGQAPERAGILAQFSVNYADGAKWELFSVGFFLDGRVKVKTREYLAGPRAFQIVGVDPLGRVGIEIRVEEKFVPIGAWYFHGSMSAQEIMQELCKDPGTKAFALSGPAQAEFLR